VKRRGSILLSLVTLAVLALGLFLPDVMITQNNGSDSSPKRYAVETIRLDTAKPVSMIDALRLVSAEHKTMNLRAGNVLDAAGARQAALEALTFATDYGMRFDVQAYTAHNETPFLLYSDDGADALVVWQCELINPVNEDLILVQLDDATGIMLSFFSHESVDLKNQPSLSVNRFSADEWAEMYVHYYGFRSVEVGTKIRKDGSFPDTSAVDAASAEVKTPIRRIKDGDVDISLQYELVFTDDDGVTLALPCYISYIIKKDYQYSSISFNF
jgi:hypothetical protein